MTEVKNSVCKGSHFYFYYAYITHCRFLAHLQSLKTDAFVREWAAGCPGRFLLRAALRAPTPILRIVTMQKMMHTGHACMHACMKATEHPLISLYASPGFAQ